MMRGATNRIRGKLTVQTRVSERGALADAFRFSLDERSTIKRKGDEDRLKSERKGRVVALFGSQSDC